MSVEDSKKNAGQEESVSPEEFRRAFRKVKSEALERLNGKNGCVLPHGWNPRPPQTKQ